MVLLAIDDKRKFKTLVKIFFLQSSYRNLKRKAHLLFRILVYATLCTSDWKKNSVPISTAIKQQSKNTRMNKAILSSLLNNPIHENDLHQVFCVGIDWTGNLHVQLLFL
jgi:hypothetical protein